MKKFFNHTLLAALIAILGMGLFVTDLYAEGEESVEENSVPKTSLTIMPVSKTWQINSNSLYDGSFSVSNDGSEEMKIEVYAAPYSYIYSEEEDLYKLGFSNENNFTQITRWISIKADDGSYVPRTQFTIPAEQTKKIEYRIATPNNIPAGGQYAVIFAQTISGNINASGIRTEASAGMIIYGHSKEGEAKTTAELRDMEIGQRINSENGVEGDNHVFATAKVKNTGNIDFFAKGKLKVDPIIGFASYETPDSGGVVSIIPESERIVQDEWTETPGFGIYKATWTLTAGDQNETIEKIIFINVVPFIIIMIIVLTIIVVTIIIGVRKRKERRARLAV